MALKDLMSSGLGSPIGSRLKHLGVVPERVFRWWLLELQDMIPNSLKTGYFSKRSKVEIVWPRPWAGGAAIVSAPIYIDGLSVGADMKPLSDRRRKQVCVYVRVAKQSFVLREIEMPIAALSELHSAAAFFVERVTPFNGENACHVARLISKDRKSRLARVELAVMPRAHLQAVRSAVEECGGHLAGLSMDGDKGMPPLNFIPPNERTARSISSFSDLWKPILFAGIAVFAVGPSAVAYMIHLNAQRLANEAASIRSESASLLKYRSEFAARVAAAAFPLALQKGPYPIEVVDALTKAAPDDTWIFRLELVPGELRLAGFSKDVPRFLEHLSSKPFTAPELIAPVVHDASGRQSRFEIKVIVPEAP